MNKAPPIIVLGCQRSGTTLLRLILDSHSRIACPPESKFLVQLARIYEIEQSRNGLLSMGLSEDNILAGLGRYAGDIFEGYCERKGKKRWADKNLHNLDHIHTIDGMFDHSPFYIGIVRHGLDVAYSLMDVEWGVMQRQMADGTPKHIAGVELWAEKNESMCNFREEVGERFLTIRYEQVTEEPEAVLRTMFTFLREPWEVGVLRYNDKEHDKGYGDEKALTYNEVVQNSERYKAWPVIMQEEAYNAGAPMFHKLGYAL